MSSYWICRTCLRRAPGAISTYPVARADQTCSLCRRDWQDDPGDAQSGRPPVSHSAERVFHQLTLADARRAAVLLRVAAPDADEDGDEPLEPPTDQGPTPDAIEAAVAAEGGHD